jgi:hypothetical protein
LRLVTGRCLIRRGKGTTFCLQKKGKFNKCIDYQGRGGGEQEKGQMAKNKGENS